MTILNIGRATRAGAHLLISVFGPPESGKTFSALLLAAGMEPDPAKRILLDTESGRGRLYAEEIPGGYQYAELTRPFTPERYVEALLEIEKAGFTVCVIDSVSHGWAGEGGVLDQAGALEKAGKKGDQIWRDPKVRYRSLSNRLLGSSMHLILCSRAKQPLIEGPVVNGKATRVRGPWIEIQERMLRYEMTAVLQMTKQGEFVIEKCPGPLRNVLMAGTTVGADMGKNIAAWVSGGDARDPAFDELKLSAEEAANGGLEALRTFWKNDLTAEQRARMKPLAGNYESIARAADAERERKAQMDREAATNLDDPFGTAAQDDPPHDAETGEITDDLPAATADIEQLWPDTKAGYADCAEAMAKALGTARTEDELDPLLTNAQRQELLVWLKDKAPERHKSVMDFAAEHRAYLQDRKAA